MTANRSHLDLRPVDPAGTKNRRWRCLDCGKIEVGLSWVHDGTCNEPKKTDDQRLLDGISDPELSSCDTASGSAKNDRGRAPYFGGQDMLTFEKLRKANTR